MKVDTRNKNKALESLFADPAQIVFLDANFFIPPDRSELMDRSRIKVKAISFPKFCEIWLDPIFEEFPNLAIHESVYNELVASAVKEYADGSYFRVRCCSCCCTSCSVPRMLSTLAHTVWSSL